ncbi:MAG: virulence factor SrfB [Saprospiraceae bacterium]|nr:virulence factor SrfB [Saprospiraceae bacterium]
MKIEIIPRPKDVAKEDHQLDERLDWIYDEASCSQINFIYSEIAKKYSSNYKDYFDIYGKKENGHNTLTVATLDIGGGTTDLMINKYRYDENDKFPHLTPEPIFYETYSSAGDDLVKNLILEEIQ